MSLSKERIRTTGRACGRVAAALVAAAGLAAAAGCGSIMDVQNPNNVNADALKNPTSAAAQVNGIVAAITRGATQLVGHLETASDNLTWSGSLDGMNQLNRGFVRDPFSEFLEDAAFGLTPARYMGARTIKQLEEFAANGELADPTQLALANLYTAITYDYIANSYDDFVITSDMSVGGEPVGSQNMVSLYDSAETALNRALAIAPATNNALKGQILAMRARAKFDRAIWRKLNPSGSTPAQPLVDDQSAADDARDALALLGGDAKLSLAVQTGMSFGNCFLPGCVNSRREIKFNPAIAKYDYTNKVLTVALNDPIAGTPDPVIRAVVTEFVTGNTLVPITVTSSRDMLLIRAEVALAQSNIPEFTTQINQLRTLNGLPGWTGDPAQPTALAMLQHERRVTLYLQGRRLNDMYRFGIADPEWDATSDAAQCPGSMFPITNTERLTNPKVGSSQPACGQ